MNEEKWEFPEDINFLDACTYLNKFREKDLNRQLFFDLSKTQYMHSSFIGFLIYVKNHSDNKRNRVTVLLSDPVRKILEMLDLIDHFKSGMIII